jgi:hypothetical protein
MRSTYYFDESGSAGDLAGRIGDLRFGGQPVFAMACVGLDADDGLADEVERLRRRFRVQKSELKAETLFPKSRLFCELVAYLRDRDAPVLVEVMDKRFSLCALLVESLVPRRLDRLDPIDPQVRPALAAFLWAYLPGEALLGFAQLCERPSNQAVLELIEFVRDLVGDDNPDALFLNILLASHAEAFRRWAREDERACEAFLPPADRSPSGKPYWMLPNQTAFANLYGRLNVLHGRGISGITMVHDEQSEFGDILRSGKATLEDLAGVGRRLRFPHTDFGFEERARLEFGRSEDHLGIQIADLLAGFVMRFVRGRMAGGKGLEEGHAVAMRELTAMVDPERSLGINFVLPEGFLIAAGLLPSGL